VATAVQEEQEECREGAGEWDGPGGLSVLSQADKDGGGCEDGDA